MVHVHHGLARFRGIERRTSLEGEIETLILEFADSARLFVPFEQAFLVSRYVGIGRLTAPLSRLGRDPLVDRQEIRGRGGRGLRRALAPHPGNSRDARRFRLSADGAWQQDFERTFPYRETADQVTAIAETKADMERSKPMDRLICGDVGFGKTEIAIRAAFKAALAGKQAAFLAPTTGPRPAALRCAARQDGGLSHSHRVAQPLSLGRQQREALEGMADGSVDIAIGTHRLLSSDVTFRDLGLLVVDEEQRFGVQHKERLRELYLPYGCIDTVSDTDTANALHGADGGTGHVLARDATGEPVRGGNGGLWL